MEEQLAKILTGPRNPNPVTLMQKFGVVHPYRPDSSLDSSFICKKAWELEIIIIIVACVWLVLNILAFQNETIANETVNGDRYSMHI